VLGLAVALAPAATAGAAPAPGGRAALFDTDRDVLVDRAFVPSAERPQGEVRIVRRDGHVVVQTLLYTRVLKRVVREIAQKERRNWPSGVAGHDDMERYVAALETFRREAPGPSGSDGQVSDRRVQMLIEFIDAPGDPLVAIGAATFEGSGEKVGIQSRAAPSVPRLGADYVRRNMALIVADAFAIDAEAATARLAAARRAAVGHAARAGDGALAACDRLWNSDGQPVTPGSGESAQ
jgi:hypothetical protein